MKNLPVARLAIAGFVLSMISFVLLDDWFYHLTLVTDPDARKIWLTITDLGSSGWMAIVTIAIGVVSAVMARLTSANQRWKKISRQSVFIFAAVAIPGIVTMILKGIIGRARPYLYDTEGPMSFDLFAFTSNFASYPSGHTTTAFAMATALILIFPKVKYPAFALAILAGFSRNTVGAHYLSDVIIGATLGTLGAIVVYRWLAPKLKL